MKYYICILIIVKNIIISIRNNILIYLITHKNFEKNSISSLYALRKNYRKIIKFIYNLCTHFIKMMFSL